MSDQKTLEKINKLKDHKKSSGIIKLMNSKHADAETIRTGLNALSEIGDEDSANEITHYLDDPDSSVRITACRCAIRIGTEYMKTRVRYQLGVEQDADTKKAIQEAFNAKFI